ncbi:uncharacterized protein [Oryza sativa Japonica Group]|uniref:Os11g0558700 protein n=1 Tax=Oryza sativa subsp. japonica TaxID=39947 RepID=Q2R2L2_ORYSJ|nr:hypothetical protein LOC_Os11g35430 [Oryza sativa Japonica Group]BAT14470.1 Os11g0558700 [Oryza sativa Japonica Group]
MAAETSVSEAAAILDVAVAGDGEAKRQLVVVDDDDDDSEPNPYEYRVFFEWLWDYYGCKIDDVTRGPTFHTPGARISPCVEVYSCRVIDLTGGLEWPIDVFGFVAARDGLDRKRNYIFNRPRDDAQTFTTEDPSFVLTGPIRAINCSQRIEFEVDLKVRGKTQSDRDKVLSARYIVYETMGPNCMVGQVRSKARPGKRCSVEVTFANLAGAVEAAIEVRVVQGSSGFCGRIVARTDGYDDDVVFADSSNDGSVLAVADDGVIKLARSVAVVESTGVLKIHAIIARSDSSGGYDGVGVAAEDHAEFAAQRFESSCRTLDLGFCKMLATVSWSMIPLI